MINHLLNWLNTSSCNFTAIQTIKKELEKQEFKELREEDKWYLKNGGKYFVIKNDTAIFAFIIGCKSNSDVHGYRIIAAHSDSPGFKLKPDPEIYCEEGIVKLNVEKYGGGILYTWFDRPLSIAGRAVCRSERLFHPESKIFDLKKDIATIPHLAIHFNRNVNEGNPVSVQKDMLPVIGRYSKNEIENVIEKGGFIKKAIAEDLSISPKEILDIDCNLYVNEEAKICGLTEEFYQSGRIDDLSMAFAGLEALMSAQDKEVSYTRVLAIFDNEETGSGTKQGAASPVLKDILSRINFLLGGNLETFQMAQANSFLISADNAHAWHPNYNEKYDPVNHPKIGGGPVIKINANCKYMTDGVSSAIFQTICHDANVKYQMFVNHSDIAGGSTLGNILTSQLAIKGVDMGAAIWGMHSARETAGISDHLNIIKVFTKFWE